MRFSILLQRTVAGTLALTAESAALSVDLRTTGVTAPSDMAALTKETTTVLTVITKGEKKNTKKGNSRRQK